MEHTFVNSFKTWTRRDDPGPVTVTEYDGVFGGHDGHDGYPAHIIEWDGPHTLTDGERVFKTDRSVTRDCGKYGLNLSYFDGIRPPMTPEQKERYWKRMADMVRDVFPGYELAIPE